MTNVYVLMGAEKKNRVWERTGEIYDYQLAPMTTTTYISMTHLFTE